MQSRRRQPDTNGGLQYNNKHCAHNPPVSDASTSPARYQGETTAWLLVQRWRCAGRHYDPPPPSHPQRIRVSTIPVDGIYPSNSCIRVVLT